MHSKLLVILIYCLCRFNKISSSSLIDSKETFDEEENLKNDPKVLEIITSSPTSFSENVSSDLSIDASTLHEPTDTLEITESTDVSNEPTTDTTTKEVLTTTTKSPGKTKRPRRQEISPGRGAKHRDESLQYNPPSTLFDMCPPLASTCPLCSVPYNQLSQYICRYPVVLKLLLISPSQTDSSGRVCGKLGKLASYGKTDGKKFRSLLRFSAKESCECQIEVSHKYYLFSKPTEFLKQGKVYSKVSLSNNTLIIPFDKYPEALLLKELLSCTSEKNISNVQNLQQVLPTEPQVSPIEPQVLSTEPQELPTEAAHEPAYTLPSNITVTEESPAQRNLEPTAVDESEKVVPRSARESYASPKPSIYRPMATPNYIPPPTYLPAPSHNFMTPVSPPIYMTAAPPSFFQVPMSRQPLQPLQPLPPLSPISSQYPLQPMLRPLQPLQPLPPLSPFPTVPPQYPTHQSYPQSSIPPMYVPPQLYGQLQPSGYRRVTYTSPNQVQSVETYAGVQYSNSPAPTFLGHSVAVSSSRDGYRVVASKPIEYGPATSSPGNSNPNGMRFGQMTPPYQNPGQPVYVETTSPPYAPPSQQYASYPPTAYGRNIAQTYTNSSSSFSSSYASSNMGIQHQQQSAASSSVHCPVVPQSCPVCFQLTPEIFRDAYCNSTYAFLSIIDMPDSSARKSVSSDLYPNGLCLKLRSQLLHDISKNVGAKVLYQGLTLLLPSSCACLPHTQGPSIIFLLGFDNQQPVPPQTQLHRDHDLFLVPAPSETTLPKCQSNYQTPVAHEEVKSQPQTYPEPVTYTAPPPVTIQYSTVQPSPNTPVITYTELPTSPPAAYEENTVPNQPEIRRYPIHEPIQMPESTPIYQDTISYTTSKATYSEASYPNPEPSRATNSDVNYQDPEPRPDVYSGRTDPNPEPSPAQYDQNNPERPPPIPNYDQQRVSVSVAAHSDFGNSSMPIQSNYQTMDMPAANYEAGRQGYQSEYPTNPQQQQEVYEAATQGPVTYIQAYEAKVCPDYVTDSCPSCDDEFDISIMSYACASPFSVIVEIQGTVLPQHRYKFPNISVKTTTSYQGKTVKISVSDTLPPSCFHMSGKVVKNFGTTPSNFQEGYIIPMVLLSKCKFHFGNLNRMLLLYSSTIPRYLPNGEIQLTEQINIASLPFGFPLPSCRPASRPIYISPLAHPSPYQRPAYPPPQPPSVTYAPRPYNRAPYQPESRDTVTPSPDDYRPSSTPDYVPPFLTSSPPYKRITGPPIYTRMASTPDPYLQPLYPSPVSYKNMDYGYPSPANRQPPAYKPFSPMPTQTSYVYQQGPDVPSHQNNPYVVAPQPKIIFDTCPKQKISCPHNAAVFPKNFREFFCSSEFAMVVAIGVDHEKHSKARGDLRNLPFLKSKGVNLNSIYDGRIYAYNVTVTRQKSFERRGSLPQKCYVERILGLYDVSPPITVHERMIDLDILVPTTCDFAVFDLSPSYGILMSTVRPDLDKPLQLSDTFAFYPLPAGRLTLPSCSLPPGAPPPNYDADPYSATKFVSTPWAAEQGVEVACTNSSCGTCSIVRPGNGYNVPCDAKFAALVEVIETSAGLNVAPTLEVQQVYDNQLYLTGVVLNVKSNVDEIQFAKPSTYETHYPGQVKCQYAKVRVVEDLLPYSRVSTKGKELTLIIPMACDCHLFRVANGYALLLVTKVPILPQYAIPITGDISSVLCLPPGSYPISICPSLTNANYQVNTPQISVTQNPPLSYSFTHVKTSAQYVPPPVPYAPAPYTFAPKPYTAEPTPYHSETTSTQYYSVQQQNFPTQGPYILTPAPYPRRPTQAHYAPSPSLRPDSTAPIDNKITPAPTPKQGEYVLSQYASTSSPVEYVSVSLENQYGPVGTQVPPPQMEYTSPSYTSKPQPYIPTQGPQILTPASYTPPPTPSAYRPIPYNQDQYAKTPLPPAPVHTYTHKPVTYAPAPVTYAPAPVTYAPAPVTYAPAPVTYAPAPVTYAPAPVTYAPAPTEYVSAPVEYPPAPVEYIPAPVEYAPAPVTYSLAQAEYVPAPAEYTPAPPVYEATSPTYNPTPERYASSYAPTTIHPSSSSDEYIKASSNTYEQPDMFVNVHGQNRATYYSAATAIVAPVPEHPPLCIPNEQVKMMDCPVCDEIRCINPEVYCNSKLAIIARPNGVYDNGTGEFSGSLISLYEVSSHKPAERALSNIIYKMKKQCSCPILQENRFVILLMEEDKSLSGSVTVTLDEGDYVYSTFSGKMTLPACTSDRPRGARTPEQIVLPGYREMLPECPTLDHSCPDCRGGVGDDRLKELVCSADKAILVSSNDTVTKGLPSLSKPEQVIITQYIAQNYSIGIEIKPHKFETPCTLPEQPGDCNSMTTRYYFDSSEELCYGFDYSGCNGNANNFQTFEECEAACMENYKCSERSLRVHKIVHGEDTNQQLDIFPYALPEHCECPQLTTGDLGYLIFNSSANDDVSPSQLNKNYIFVQLSDAQLTSEVVCDSDTDNTEDEVSEITDSDATDHETDNTEETLTTTKAPKKNKWGWFGKS